jgi:hypothetical protein|tara:strand:- start:51313 stop:52701 length:1389 start_codon:yes stop_codon:yes gene_type:complete
MPLTFEQIRTALAGQELFEDKTWKLSPEAFPITAPQLREIESIGQACAEFYRALEFLYLRSATDKNILRNRKLRTPWVVDYLDRGKPEGLLRHARSDKVKGRCPVVIRPDLLITDDGFALTEMDSVPGGIGLTAFLNQLYLGDGEIIGGKDGMLEAFYGALAGQRSDVSNPLIVIVVSDEAATYRPEMDWLALQLQSKGYRVHSIHPSDLMPLGESLCADIDGNPEEIDIVYRFWELFDLPNLALKDFIFDHIDTSALVVTPPMRPFQEEKLNLALFHHPRLQDFWREQLSKRALKTLRKIVPRGWIMDPVDLPPNAVLDAPEVGGHPIHRWEQLAEASQKERNLIIKLSGFHENAWGARSVLYGSDASRVEWSDGLNDALSESGVNLSILQAYEKPRRIQHPIFAEAEKTYSMEGRVRLCPYYFVEGEKTTLGGILATVCPADKKIIHGMRDAAMLPCKAV